LNAGILEHRFLTSVKGQT